MIQSPSQVLRGVGGKKNKRPRKIYAKCPRKKRVLEKFGETKRREITEAAPMKGKEKKKGVQVQSWKCRRKNPWNKRSVGRRRDNMAQFDNWSDGRLRGSEKKKPTALGGLGRPD